MNLTAVLIDDSRTVRACLKIYLSELGFEILAEGSRGDHALELWEKHRPTLMTLDIVLPGLDGVTAVTELMRKHPEAVVVMCSSINVGEKVLACRQAGAAHYLLKPITRENVTAIARSITSRLPQPAPSQKVG